MRSIRHGRTSVPLGGLSRVMVMVVAVADHRPVVRTDSWMPETKLVAIDVRDAEPSASKRQRVSEDDTSAPEAS